MTFTHKKRSGKGWPFKVNRVAQRLVHVEHGSTRFPVLAVPEGERYPLSID